MKGYKVQTGKNRDIPIFEIFNNIDKFTEKRIYFKNDPYKFENIETFDRTFKHKWFKNKKSALNYIKEYLLIKKIIIKIE